MTKVIYFLSLCVLLGLLDGREKLSPIQSADQLNTAKEELRLSRFVPWAIPDKAQMVVRLEGGERFTVPLAENGTTGYQWQVECEQGSTEIVKLLRSDFHLPSSDRQMCGAGGTRIFTFATDKGGGSATLFFRYVRPWEKNIAPVKELIIYLTVEKDN